MLKKILLLTVALVFIFCCGCSPEPGGPSDGQTGVGEFFDEINSEWMDRVMEAEWKREYEEVEEREGVFTPCAIFSDNGVLQRNAVNHIFGKCSFEGEFFAVVGEKAYRGEAKGGAFSVYLPPMQAQKDVTLQLISSAGKRTLKNLCVGELLLLSGQSNMAMRLSDSMTGDGGSHSGKYVPTENEPTYGAYIQDSIERNTYIKKVTTDFLYDECEKPVIRLCTVQTHSSMSYVFEENIKAENVNAEWKECSSESAYNFSALGAYLGVALHELAGVPIGLVNISIGATFMATWTAEEDYQNNEADYIYGGKNATEPINRGAACFNQYIHPIAGARFRAAVWYQGEGQSVNFSKNLRALIQSWRKSFGYELPFILVGLPTYGGDDTLPKSPNAYGDEMPSYSGAWFAIREGQKSVSQSLPECYVTVNTDCGDYDEIHPYDKREMGKRVAYKIAEVFYGYVREDMVTPQAVAARATESGIEITFDRVGRGILVTNGGINLEASYDGSTYIPCEAEMQGEVLLMKAERPMEIKAVRYGYNNYPRLTRNDVRDYYSLYTADGLPVSQFAFTLS
ncbi:MAG: hypothetical protein IJF71_04750 [Clostridia bacterium]|nr:hypothetical protein [Clostridia bacterium]